MQTIPLTRRKSKCNEGILGNNNQDLGTSILGNEPGTHYTVFEELVCVLKAVCLRRVVMNMKIQDLCRVIKGFCCFPSLNFGLQDFNAWNIVVGSYL